MVRKLAWLVSLIILCTPLLVKAEPISFEQAANVTGLTGIEFGVNFDYSYEKIEAGGDTLLATVMDTVNEIPIFIRLGFPVLEIKVTIPYGDVKENVDSALAENFSGIRNVGVGVKTGLLGLPVFNLAIGLNTKFPTAEPSKYFFGEGLALNPFVAADLDINIMKLHAQLGYEYRGEYNSSYNPVDQTVGDAVKLKPGDATHWAVGLEIPAGSVFFLHAEILATSYGEVKMDELALPNTEGATMSFIPGIRIQQGPFKAKLGVAIPFEKQDDRPLFAPRSDWRIMGGVSLLFGM